MIEKVILVNEHDEALGEMEKLEAHQKGLLHRAFSIFIFNSRKELLLQQRALSKYHSPGLWTNTCCSHPRPGEKTAGAAARRLREEMGMICELKFHSHFIYKANVENGLVEHELDHVFTGTSVSDPVINTDEVMDWKWLSLPELKKEVSEHPEQYTAWLKIILEKELPLV